MQRDFVPFIERAAHGARHGGRVDFGRRFAFGARPIAAPRLYAASVFFADAKGTTATTASSWPRSSGSCREGVRVINMSLAGPPNRVLEAAIAALGERGVARRRGGRQQRSRGRAAVPRGLRDRRRRDRRRLFEPDLSLREPRPPGDVRRAGRRIKSRTATAATGIGPARRWRRRTQRRSSRAARARGQSRSAAVLAALKPRQSISARRTFDDVFGFGLIAAWTDTAFRTGVEGHRVDRLGEVDARQVRTIVRVPVADARTTRA